MRHLIGLGLVMVMACVTQAQTIRVVGKVVNATNTPVAGASIELLKSKTKATTGADGSFTLAGGDLRLEGQPSEKKRC
jgi:hypothetical protein